MGADGWSWLPAGEAAGRTGGGEVMRAHVSDGEEFFFPYHGRLDMSSPPPTLSPQSPLLSFLLPVWSNETWRSVFPGEGGGAAGRCSSAAVSLSGLVHSHRGHGRRDVTPCSAACGIHVAL